MPLGLRIGKVCQAMISSRHIRHDWPEWVDWDNQKSVKTMCGARSRPGLCGVPGVSKQESVVIKNNKQVWGWCQPCVSKTFPYYLPPALTAYVTRPEIIWLHEQARRELAPQYHNYLLGKLSHYLHQGFNGNAIATERDIAALEKDYPWINAPRSS